MRAANSRLHGLSLVELIVVIAILGVMIGLLLPAVHAARSSVRRVECQNKMRQIGLAIHAYHGLFDQFPPSKWGIEDSKDPRLKHNILAFLLPFLERQTIYERLDFGVHWFDNEATKVHLPLFHCPEAPRTARYGNNEYFAADYAVAERMNRTTGKIKPLFDDGIVAERSSLMGMLQPPTIVEYNPVTMTSKIVPWTTTATSVSDGLSTTMMFFECAARPFRYIKGRMYVDTLDSSLTRPVSGADWASNCAAFYMQESCGSGGTQLFNCTNNNEIYSFHPNGANFVFGDATVRFLSEEIHPDAFISLFTAFAGDMVKTP